MRNVYVSFILSVYMRVDLISLGELVLDISVSKFCLSGKKLLTFLLGCWLQSIPCFRPFSAHLIADSTSGLPAASSKANLLSSPYRIQLFPSSVKGVSQSLFSTYNCRGFSGSYKCQKEVWYRHSHSHRHAYSYIDGTHTHTYIFLCIPVSIYSHMYFYMYI